MSKSVVLRHAIEEITALRKQNQLGFVILRIAGPTGMQNFGFLFFGFEFLAKSQTQALAIKSRVAQIWAHRAADGAL